MSERFILSSIKAKYDHQHCKVIIGRNPIEANANTVAIQLPGNPVAYIGKCFTPYQEFLQPLQVNYHLLANYPQKLKQFPVQAEGFADRSVKYLYYTYNLPIYIYSVHYRNQSTNFNVIIKGKLCNQTQQKLYSAYLLPVMTTGTSL